MGESTHLYSQRKELVLKIQTQLRLVRKHACQSAWQLLHKNYFMHVLSRLWQCYNQSVHPERQRKYDSISVMVMHHVLD
jgi:hypothetical protein